MKSNFFFVFVSIFLLTSCKQDKFILMVEQPVKESLNKKVLKISLGNVILNDTLQSTDIVPTFKTYQLQSTARNKLLMQLDTVSLQLELTYPNDKYIIISPTVNSKGIVHFGVVKQKEKFILH